MRRKLEPPLEKHEEALCIEAYQLAGCIVVSFAQPRATMQSAGIPDLLIFDPRTQTSWWHEVKRKQGPGWKRVNSKQSEGQKEFQRYVEECRGEYILGPLDAALAKLRALGRVA